jgi:ArsR family transcriptional regulator
MIMEIKLDHRECRLLADFFTLFGSGTRLQVFCALQGGRKTVSELAALAGVSLQNVSQHLRLMREKGAVATEKEGQHVYYSVVDRRLLQGACLIRDALLDATRRRASEVLSGVEAETR